MVIDFKERAEEVLEHFNGGEKEFIVRRYMDDKCKIMKGLLHSGASIGEHTHTTNCEFIHIIEGRGTVLMDGVYEDVEADQCHYCPKGHSHSLINNSDADLHFFATVVEQ